MQPGSDLVTWALNQGVAVVVAAFVLIRLDARLADLQKTMDRLVEHFLDHDLSTPTPRQPSC